MTTIFFYSYYCCGLSYSLTVSQIFDLWQVAVLILIEAFSEQGKLPNLLAFCRYRNAVYYYSVQSQTRQETTLYAITGDMTRHTGPNPLALLGKARRRSRAAL